jgi:hypothetical protein
LLDALEFLAVVALLAGLALLVVGFPRLRKRRPDDAPEWGASGRPTRSLHVDDHQASERTGVGAAAPLVRRRAGWCGKARRGPMDARGIHDGARVRMPLTGAAEKPGQGRVGECAARDSNPEPAD